MNRNWAAPGAGLMLLMVAVCIAQQQPAQPLDLEQRFRQLDRDGDGKLSPDELRGELFERLDTNKDGVVTLEEARAGLAGGTRQRPRQAGRTEAVPIPNQASALQEVAAMFELCVRDVEAVARFYCDGIGMTRTEQLDPQGSTLLEWQGTYLRLRQVNGEPSAPPSSPIRQILASNGFRWFSLWFVDVSTVEQRIVLAGYSQPVQARNVSFVRDPEGNLVELMRLPRDVTQDTFTVAMIAQDEAVSRDFYGTNLGLPAFSPMRLPPPFSMDMPQYGVGQGRVKFAAPPEQRPNDADLGPDAPGIRSLTLWVADIEKAQQTLAQRGTSFEQTASGQPDNRLALADPDGNRIFVAAAPPWLLQEATAAGPTAVAGDEAWPGGPRLRVMPGDSGADAAGCGQLFESIVVPGFTDIQEGTNGIAIADLNGDGLPDIVATYSPPRGRGSAWGAGERLRVFINEGDFRFRQHPIQLLGSEVSTEAFGRGQVPVLADLNNDGFLDLFVTRHAPMQAGQNRRGLPSHGNSLFVSEGAWNTFRDVSEQMGIRNELAYNRQPAIGDVNRDGWLDIAVGCDNIGDAQGGFPHSRLYIFRPGGQSFEEGSFEDIGGTDLVPDFGGFYHDSARDKAGPNIRLVDLDNDGDLDLLQSYHVDVRDPSSPYSPAEYRQGVFCWRNLHAETGELRFEKVTGNGLACEARLKWDPATQSYEALGSAPGLPYVSLADVNNNGLLDVLAVGPASPGWAPRAEYVSGRFWQNKGDFQFQEATAAAGLAALNWLYGDWFKFFEASPPVRPGARVDPMERRPYFADALLGDFDNDGWVDMVVLDRHESPNLQARAILFLNRGDGTFEPMPTTFSGLDGMGICGQVADLNNDGLLDIVFAADPDNSGMAQSMDRYEDKVYYNTGLHGARDNHWLRLRFVGVSHALLIGARVEVYEAGTDRLLGMRAISPTDSYKSGGSLEAHFGLGRIPVVDVRVMLPDGNAVACPAVEVDRCVEVNLATGVAVLGRASAWASRGRQPEQPAGRFWG